MLKAACTLVAWLVMSSTANAEQSAAELCAALDQKEGAMCEIVAADIGDSVSGGKKVPVLITGFTIPEVAMRWRTEAIRAGAVFCAAMEESGIPGATVVAVVGLPFNHQANSCTSMRDPG